MTVGHTERDFVYSGLPFGGAQSCANMRIKHSEFQLEVLQAGIRFPFTSIRVKGGDADAVYL